MLSSKGFQAVARQQLLAQPLRHFSVLPQLPKLELTMRTPYRTFFENFNGFLRVYVQTAKGQISIGNRSIPRVYVLPPGEIMVKQMTAGEGNFAEGDSGLFIHTGGWLHLHDNNSLDINLLECVEREKFAFDRLDGLQTNESETAAGRVAAALQEKTVKILNRRR